MAYVALFSSKLRHFALFCVLETPQNHMFYEKMPAPPQTAQDDTPGGHICRTYTHPLTWVQGQGASLSPRQHGKVGLEPHRFFFGHCLI